MDKDLQSIQEARDLLARAQEAQHALARMSQERLDAIVAAVSRAGAENARRLGQMAAEETGFGRADHKEIKNRFAAVTVYEAIRGLKTVGILAEDRERHTLDLGTPVGVVVGLVPSTNPTSTVIYKTLIALKAGNPIVFSPHPGALRCILETVKLLAAAADEGVPAPALCQPALSMLNTGALEELLPLCEKEGVGVVPYQLLQGGMLTGKYRRGQEAPAGSRLAEKPEWMKPFTDETYDVIERCAAEAAAEGVTMTQHALRWALAQPGVVSALVGVKREEQIDEAAGAVR